MKISIVYFSSTGRTERMANVIAEGMKKAGDVEVGIFPIDALDVDFVNDSAAVIVGTPDYYAAEAWQVKQWLDTCPCKLGGKMGGAFCTANFKQGGADVAIQSVLTQMLVKGMLIYSSGTHLGLPFIHLGPVCLKDSEEDDKALFDTYGQRFAAKAIELF